MKNLSLRLKGLMKLLHMNFWTNLTILFATMGIVAATAVAEMAFVYLPGVVDFSQLSSWGKALFWGTGAMAVFATVVIAWWISLTLKNTAFICLAAWRRTKRYDPDTLIYRENLMESVKSDMPRVEATVLALITTCLALTLLLGVGPHIVARFVGGMDVVLLFVLAKVFPVCYFGTLAIFVVESVLIVFGYVAMLTAIQRHNEPILRSQHQRCER